MIDGRIFDAFRDPVLVRAVAGRLRSLALPRPITIMHVCGTHEHAIARSGLRALLPSGIRLVAGPGCPVCVCPARDVDLALAAARRPETILATFGDMFRVPASEGSLEAAKAEGADVRVVYSPLDAVRLARGNPAREVVFMAVGFETTAAPIAAACLADTPPNFSIIPSLRLIPPALRFLLARGARSIDAFLLPGHVSAVIGSRAYSFLAAEHGVPAVIAGFEPVDIIRGVEEAARQIASGAPGVVANLYGRVVHDAGNERACEIIDSVFERSDAHWRGIGAIPDSGLALRPERGALDAAARLGLACSAAPVDVREGCLCHLVILGEVEPEECPLFGSDCTPRVPYGPCMVSSEGTCRARYLYRTPGARGGME